MDEKGDPKGVCRDCHLYALEAREIREQELAERMAERRRQALSIKSRGRSVRARMARRIFALAVAAGRKETCNVVWERLEGRPMRRDSPRGAVGHGGMGSILLERCVEPSDSRRNFTERGAQT